MKESLASNPTRFSHIIRVHFGDTDHAGIVYFPRIFHYCHIAFEEWFHTDLGYPFSQVVGERSYGLPVVSTKSVFQKPMRHGEHIRIELTIERITTRSVTFGYRLIGVSDDVVRARVEIVHASVNLQQFVSVPIPSDLVDLFCKPSKT
ncbi:MAG: acyl-CoA thioesterase [Myxococcales bacterium]|nr:acyl-CoA thioesterase [Myxococcales bacterium]